MHLSRIVAEWETNGQTWFWVWRGRPKPEEVRNFIVSSYQCFFRAGKYDTWGIESKSAFLCLPGSCGGRLEGSDPVIWEVVIFHSPLVASIVRQPFLLSASLLSSYIISCYRHLQAWWASEENKYLKKITERRRRTVPNRQVCLSCHVSGSVIYAT